ncbi:hypothetical protein PG997_004956 [Apiospora hydei]|uniref:Secreted protein n=1 Tax=Apiospora hydei TaxID=1337664 RepID=A0ABR1X3N6_9PEZI
MTLVNTVVISQVAAAAAAAAEEEKLVECRDKNTSPTTAAAAAACQARIVAFGCGRPHTLVAKNRMIASWIRKAKERSTPRDPASEVRGAHGAEVFLSFLLTLFVSFLDRLLWISSLHFQFQLASPVPAVPQLNPPAVRNPD